MFVTLFNLKPWDRLICQAGYMQESEHSPKTAVNSAAHAAQWEEDEWAVQGKQDCLASRELIYRELSGTVQLCNTWLLQT